jgi:hypothetical protein
MSESKTAADASRLNEPADSWDDLVAFLNELEPKGLVVLVVLRHKGYVEGDTPAGNYDPECPALWICAQNRTTHVMAQDATNLAVREGGRLPSYSEALVVFYQVCVAALSLNGFRSLDVPLDKEDERFLDILTMHEDDQASHSRIVRKWVPTLTGSHPWEPCAAFGLLYSMGHEQAETIAGTLVLIPRNTTDAELTAFATQLAANERQSREAHGVAEQRARLLARKTQPARMYPYRPGSNVAVVEETTKASQASAKESKKPPVIVAAVEDDDDDDGLTLVDIVTGSSSVARARGNASDLAASVPSAPASTSAVSIDD